MAVNIDNFEGYEQRINSPRTIEACLSLGVDIASLYPKTAADMLEAAGYKPHVANVLAEHYEQKRVQTIQAVRAERARAVSGGAGEVGLSASLRKGGIRTSTPGASAFHEAGESSLIQRERLRAEKAKEKQRQDMEQLVMNEARMVKMAEAAAASDRARYEAEQTRKRDAIVAKKKALEKKKKQEDARKAEADARVNAIRAEAARILAAELEEKKKAEREYKEFVAHQKREEEAHRLAVLQAEREKAAAAAQQQRELERRLAEWKIKEDDRNRKLEETVAAARAEAEAKAAHAAAALEETLRRDAERMAKRRNDFEERVKEAEKRRHEKMMQEAEAAKRRAAARAVKQNKMREAMLRARAEELEWTHKLAEKAAAKDAALEEQKKTVASAVEEHAATATLRLFERTDAVRRARLHDEYVRLQKLACVMAEEERVKAEAAETERLKNERQAQQKRMLLMKHVAETELEAMRVRSNFSGLARVMEKAMAASSSRRGGREEDA